MNCQGQRTLYIKANGEMPCEHDIGEQVVLAKVFPNQPFSLADVLNNARFRHLSQSMGNNRAPWPLVCQRCAFFRPDELLEARTRQRRLEKIQVETTLACALRCPGCSGVSQIAQRPGPHVLPLASYKALLQACKDDAFQVDWIEYCGQGEPLNHKDFPAFLDATARILPRTRQRIITNGNHAFDAKFPDQLPDEIMVSCDGAFQDSYAQYRVNGRIDKVKAFMGRAVERARDADTQCRVIWKYILFDHNDSDTEILHAQQDASVLGVDQILFVATHSVNRSRRYTNANLSSLPIVTERAVHNATPILYRTDVDASATPENALPSPFIHLVVDEDRTSVLGERHIRGWAVGDFGCTLERTQVLDGDQIVGELATGCPRPDVSDAFPQWNLETAGFEGVVRMAASAQVRLRVTLGGQIVDLDLPPSPGESDAVPTFTPETARPAAGLEVVLGNGRVLRVPIEADPVLVARMAAALER